MKFALEHSNPLRAGAVTGAEPFYPEGSCSAAAISGQDVLLWALKPAEDGVAEAGIVARVWNLGTAPESFLLSSPLGQIRAAKRTTHLETVLADAALEGGAISAGIRENEMLTFSFFLER